MVALNALSRRTFITKVYEDGHTPEDDHEDAQYITMDGKHLDVGGLVIPEPDYYDDHDLVCWQYKVQGLYHSGKLHLNKARTILTGHVVSGEHHTTAKITNFVGFIAPTIYKTKLTDDGKPRDGPDVKIGYKMDPVTHFPTQIFEIDEIETEVAVTWDPNHSVTTYTVLESALTLEYSALDPNFPVSATLNMRFDGLHFEGSFTPLDPETNKAASKPMTWTGDAPPKVGRSKPIFNLLSQPSPMMYLPAADSLSVMELFGMAQPPAGVQDMAQKFLIRNMKYYMKEDWLKNFFGEQRPLIPDDDPVMKIIKAKGAKEFYSEDFAIAYLGQTFYQNPPPDAQTKITKDDALKLKYHLTSALAKSPAYNDQTSALYLEAFQYQQERLKAYIEDQKTRSQSDFWAQQLFSVLTSPQQINIMVTRVLNHIGGDPNVEFKTYGTILNLLQPSGDLSGKMMKTLVSAITGKMSQDINDDNKDRIKSWIVDVVGKFISDYEVSPSDPKSEKELARQAQAQALKQAAEMVGGVGSLGESIADILAAVKSPSFGSFGKVKELMDKFKINNPSMAKWSGKAVNALGKAFTVLAYAGGVYTLIISFKDWSQLNPAQKSRAIADAVHMAGMLALDLPKAIGFVGAKAVQVLDAVRNFFLKFDICERIGEMFSRVSSQVGEWLGELAESLSRYFPKTIGRIVVSSGDMLAKLYSKLPTALEFLGPIVSLAACAVSTYSFVKDLINGAPTLQSALDGIQAASALLETVFLVVNLTVETCWAGPLAAFFAVVGLVAALVMMFDPPKPPPSPAEVFITCDLKDFLAKLPAPPADWKEPDSAKDKK